MTPNQWNRVFVMIILAMAIAFVSVLHRMDVVIEQPIAVEKPKVIQGDWTFFQYQPGWVNVIYTKEHYFENGKLYYRDREAGAWIPLKDEGNITPAAGWIEDEAELASYGVFTFHDDEYFGLQGGGKK